MIKDADENPYHRLHLEGHDHAVRALAARGRTLVSGSYDCTVRILDIITGACRWVLVGHTQKGRIPFTFVLFDIRRLTLAIFLVYSVVLDLGRNQACSGSMDGTVRVWNLQTGQCQHTLTGHTSLVGLLGLSPSYLVSAAADSTLRIWDPDTGDLRHTLAAHTGAITCFQHDEFKVLSGSDGNLKMWNIRDGAVVRDLLTGITGVWQVVFEGRWCVAASNRNDATVLDVWDFGNEEDEEWLGEPPGGLYDEDGFSDAEEDEDEFTKRIKRMTEIEEDNEDQEQADIDAMDQDLVPSESESIEIKVELQPRHHHHRREENPDDDVDIDIQGDSDTEPMGVEASRWAPTTTTVTTTRTTHTHNSRPRVGPSRRPQLPPSSGGPSSAPLIGQLPDNNETPTRPRRPLTRRP